MALEVQSQSYLYLEKSINQTTTDAVEYKSSIKTNFANTLVEPDNKSNENFDFCHNVLHDLESLFWIALWFLLYCVPKSPKRPSSLETIECQLQIANDIFSDQTALGNCSSMCTNILMAYGKGIKGIVLQPDFAPFMRTLNHLGTLITQVYVNIKKTEQFQSIGHKALAKKPPIKVYSNFKLAFEACLGNCTEDVIKIAMAHISIKRKLGTNDYDTDERLRQRQK